MDYSTSTALLIGCYVNETDKRSSARPPLDVFFRELFDSFCGQKLPRIIFSDDGSVQAIQADVLRLASTWPIEVCFQPHRGELANLCYLKSRLKDEEYVAYLANDCFVRNLDGEDWLGVEREILNEINPFVATIRAGFKPGNGEWDYRQDGEYQFLKMVTTQHFMMKREIFDAVPWEHIAVEAAENPVSWEMRLQQYVPSDFADRIHVAYATPRLGMWSIAHRYTPEKVRRIRQTEEQLEINL